MNELKAENDRKKRDLETTRSSLGQEKENRDRISAELETKKDEIASVSSKILDLTAKRNGYELQLYEITNKLENQEANAIKMEKIKKAEKLTLKGIKSKEEQIEKLKHKLNPLENSLNENESELRKLNNSKRSNQRQIEQIKINFDNKKDKFKYMEHQQKENEIKNKEVDSKIKEISSKIEKHSTLEIMQHENIAKNELE